MAKHIELTAPLGFLLLHELRSPMTGTTLAKIIGERRNGILTPGTIYPALKELKRKKLVKFRRQGREKYYERTATGTKELEDLYKEFSTLFRGLRHKIRPVYKKR